MGLVEKEVDDGVGVLRLWKDAMVLLSGELDTAMLKPLIGIAVVKHFEKTFQQSVASRIDALQVNHILKRVGAVAASAA